MDNSTIHAIGIPLPIPLGPGLVLDRGHGAPDGRTPRARIRHTGSGFGGSRPLHSSWSDPVFGAAAREAVLAGIRHLKRVHGLTTQILDALGDPDPMGFCRHCVRAFDLPPFAATPMVARTFRPHREAVGADLDAILAPFLKT